LAETKKIESINQAKKESAEKNLDRLVNLDLDACNNNSRVIRPRLLQFFCTRGRARVPLDTPSRHAHTSCPKNRRRSKSQNTARTLVAGIFRCRCRMLTKRTSHCFSSETRFQHCPEHNSTPTRPSMVTSGTGGELVARDRLARSYFQFFTFISITTQDALAGLLRFTDTFGARLKIKKSYQLDKGRNFNTSGHTEWSHKF
jgi:hypothetical protein